MGCPKGRNIKCEIDLLPTNQRNFVIDLYKESYDVLGVDYKTRQLNIFGLKE